MKSKAWVLMPHKIRKGDNGIEVENEILPLVMCCDCVKRGFDDCPLYGWKPDLTDGDFFCADGERRSE